MDTDNERELPMNRERTMNRENHGPVYTRQNERGQNVSWWDGVDGETYTVTGVGFRCARLDITFQDGSRQSCIIPDGEAWNLLAAVRCATANG